MHEVYHQNFLKQKDAIKDCIANFEANGIEFVNGKRNKIKLFELDGITANIKSFKIPNIINKVAYTFFRHSKARRSYEFATILIKKGIGTPQPIAYFENFKGVLYDSYYVSEQLNADLTFRELTTNLNYPDHDKILRQFTQFSFNLHENGIEFLDHTPGNTLIKKRADGEYDFFLVDLNRMQFHKAMTLQQRIKNLSKLTPNRGLVEIMSDEYAKLYGQSYEEVLKMMIAETQAFRDRFYRKKRIKKQLKFWK